MCSLDKLGCQGELPHHSAEGHPPLPRESEKSPWDGERVVQGRIMPMFKFFTPKWSFHSLDPQKSCHQWLTACYNQAGGGDGVVGLEFLILDSPGLQEMTQIHSHIPPEHGFFLFGPRRKEEFLATCNGRVLWLSLLFPCNSSVAAPRLFCNYCFQLGERNIHKQYIFKKYLLHWK